MADRRVYHRLRRIPATVIRFIQARFDLRLIHRVQKVLDSARIERSAGESGPGQQDEKDELQPFATDRHTSLRDRAKARDGAPTHRLRKVQGVDCESTAERGSIRGFIAPEEDAKRTPEARRADWRERDGAHAEPTTALRDPPPARARRQESPEEATRPRGWQARIEAPRGR